ncbi:MAG TPA: DUF72 domain-containing protein [Chryseosolibacter sp.]
MEFGKVTSEELEQITFTLPPDRLETVALLAKQKRENPPRAFVGCAKWGRKDWVGTIYPKGTKEADFLSHYAKFFNTIELNATFYKLPSRTQTSAWKSKVGPDFRFCPKFSDKITHLRRLKDAKEMTDRFLEGISGFGENLGPAFLMAHPSMGPKTMETIAQFLETLPKDFEVFVELRQADWFKNQDAFSAMFNIFEQAKVGSVITDASGRRDCVHMRLTTPQAFIRFVGNGLHPSDYSRVDQWVERIKVWFDQGMQKVYFFMHQHDEIHSPELSKYVIEQLNSVCSTGLPVPKFLN